MSEPNNNDSGVSASDAAAINAALGITPSAAPEGGEEVAAKQPDPSPAAVETSETAPTATASTTVETAAPVSAAPTPSDIPVDKLQALLQAKKRMEAPAAKAAQEAAELAQQAARARDEAEAARREAAETRKLIDLVRKDPVKFLKEVAKIEDPKELDRISRDVYMYTLGDKAPQAYSEVQRRRENETEVDMLRRKVYEVENKIESRHMEEASRAAMNDYVAKSKSTMSAVQAKEAPWVARHFKANPDAATQELVNLAVYVHQQTGETMQPADLISVLESEMTKKFGKYDFGEARPTTPTLNNSLSTPAKRSSPGMDDSKESSLERIIAGIEAGEHLRE